MQQTIYIIISSLAGGGAERVCVNLCNSLAESGYKVELTVISLNDDVFSKQLSEHVILNNFNQKRIRNSIIPLYKYLRDRKNKTLLVFNYEIEVILLVIKQICRWPATIILRSMSILSQYLESHTGIKKLLIKGVIHRISKSDKIICQSKGMQKDILDYLHIPIEQTVVINNPVAKEISEFTKLNLKDVLEYHKQDYFLYIGRFAEVKGLFELLDAFCLVCKINKTIRLKLVGKGVLKQALEEYSSQLAIIDRVEFLPFTPDIIPLYLGANTTVLSSFREGFPNVLIESIALGTPIIAFDCPSGPRDIIVENINGYLVKERNSESLAKKMLQALDKTWDKQAIIETSAQYYSRNITREYVKYIVNELEA